MENSQNGSASVDVGFGCGSVASGHESLARTSLSPGTPFTFLYLLYIHICVCVCVCVYNHVTYFFCFLF